MLPRESLIHWRDRKTLWRKYCGFLDLSIQEFMAIQRELLLEQMELVSGGILARKIMSDAKPGSIEEFRSLVPMTTYDDYRPYLEEQREDVLAETPVCWVHTSGRDSEFKWVPYTLRAYQRLIDSLVSALVLASATRKGEVRLRKRPRIMFHLPKRPYLAGQFAFGLSQRIACQPIPPIETFERMSPDERQEEEMAMVKRHGVDFIFSLPGNLAEMGALFAERLNQDGSIPFSPLSPRRNLQMIRTKLAAKLRDKPLRPHHWCRPQGIICIGADSHFSRDDIHYFWGQRPYDIYLATETGCLALPAWGGADMTFTPFSGFLEFIPEEEWTKTSGPPDTLLLNELEAGKRYEMVVTSFYGMPFLRYRLGDIIKVNTSGYRDSLPQIVFEARSNDIITHGPLELSEKKLWQALLNSGLRCQDWFVVSDHAGLELYLELKGELGWEMEQLVAGAKTLITAGNGKLGREDSGSHLRVNILPRGTFRRYYEEAQAAGLDPTCTKPVHINPPDSLVRRLIPGHGVEKIRVS